MSASPYDAPLPALREHAEDLGTWLGIWEHRQEPDAHARRCASDAVDAIDAMLGHLYGVRAQLVAEIRQSDDAAAARADALVERLRADQRGPPPSPGTGPLNGAPGQPQGRADNCSR